MMCIFAIKKGVDSLQSRSYNRILTSPIKEIRQLLEINPVNNRIQDLTERSNGLRGYL